MKTEDFLSAITTLAAKYEAENPFDTLGLYVEIDEGLYEWDGETMVKREIGLWIGDDTE